MDLPWRLFSGIVVVWVLVGFVPFLFWKDVHAAAEFANTFGFVNALFAALAFGGVIWAIRLQTRELELQRLEIEETRNELRRSADAQHQSQQMHFLSALLTARNNVAQAYATAAEHETGSLKPSLIAHRQHLAELEWLLQIVDRHESNPFALPSASVLVANQIALLLKRTHPILQSAIANRAANHVRSTVLEMNQSLRDLRRLLADGDAGQGELAGALDRNILRAETVATAHDFDDIAATCGQVCDELGSHAAAAMATAWPKSRSSAESQRPSGNRGDAA
jgi:hypothetical protein